jgi:hypothetical protein
MRGLLRDGRWVMVQERSKIQAGRGVVRRRGAVFAGRPLAVALACAGLMSAQAQQLPSFNSFVVRGGNVSVGPPTTGGTVLPILQGSQRAIVDWSTFSIAAIPSTSPSPASAACC